MSDRGWYARLKARLASANNIHRPSGQPDVFLFSVPRGGSTWLAELIATQPGFKPCDEPFNLRTPGVAAELDWLGIRTWSDFHGDRAEPAMRAYIQAIADGTSGHMNPFFYRNHFRLVTHRIVFKILHAGEDRINWFREQFNGRIALLLRHPLPVTLSRKTLPRLQALLDSECTKTLSEEQRHLARRLADSGSERERGVLDWCLQYALPLRHATEDWAVVTYEQLVLEPQIVIRYLAEKLDLPRPEAMLRRVKVPSSSTHQSDAASRQMLQGDRPNRDRWLVEKWRSKVGDSEEKHLMEILLAFGIDAYRSGSALPTARFWLTP